MIQTQTYYTQHAAPYIPATVPHFLGLYFIQHGYQLRNCGIHNMTQQRAENHLKHKLPKI